MADEEPTGSCILQPCHRSPLPEDEPVCLPHRSKVAGQLRDIPALVDELRGEPAADVTTGEERTEERADHLVDLAGSLAAVVRVEHLHLVDVHAGAGPGQSGAPRVHGSREAPMPISADRTDLLATARVPSITHAYPGQLDDQVGHLAVATVLDGWCRDFAETRRESAPEPIPAAQCRYLGDRLEWAFKQHEAVDEFAGEVGDLWHTLRRAAGLTTPQPELCVGVPCRRADCDVKTLWRIPGSDYVECGSCGALLTETEYQAWCKLLAAATRGRRTA
jgi:hypothetical protein